MCRVATFCCGCSLRAGAITAAIFNLIGVIILVIGGAICFYAAAAAENQEDEDSELIVKTLHIFGGIYIFFAVLGLIIFICLCVAIKQNRPGFLMPWLVCAMIAIVVVCISLIVGLFNGAWGNLAGLAYHGFFIYLWIVVLSYYHELHASDGLNSGKI